MYPKQEAAIFSTERYAIIEGSTKCGKTGACIAWLLERALSGRPGHAFWWVSPVYPQAKIAFRRLKRGIRPDLYTANESELTITLANGATIAFKSAEKPDNLYGEDVFAAVMDEASRMREQSWHAVRSTLTATRGPIRIIGNVVGRRNWAYQMARRAEGGEPGWAYSKLTAADAIEAGIVASDEIEQAESQLPDAVFRELYFAEPSDDGGNPFGQESIRECIGDISTAAPVVYGVDLAKSVDWTVVVGLDDTGAVCRFDRYQWPWEETVRRLATEIGGTPAVVDSTGVGDPIVERLQRELGNVEGYSFSSDGRAGRRDPARRDQVSTGGHRVRTRCVRVRVYPDGRQVFGAVGDARRLRDGVIAGGVWPDRGAGCRCMVTTTSDEQLDALRGMC